MTPFDTVGIDPFDRVEINLFDTIEMNHFDAVEIKPFDTVGISPFDTLGINLFDTVGSNPLDTVRINRSTRARSTSLKSSHALRINCQGIQVDNCIEAWCRSTGSTTRQPLRYTDSH